MNIVIGIGVFIVTVLLIEGGYLFFRSINNPEVKGIRKQLKLLSQGYRTDEIISLIRKRSLSEVPWLNRVLLKIPLMHKIDRILEQSNTPYPLGVFILLSGLFVFIGYVICLKAASSALISVIGAFVLGLIPFFYIDFRKKRRMQKFEQQLPEAMDLIARALKAGHTFSGGLKMITDEFGDPIGTEFSKVLDEINFGVSIPDALKNLGERIDCPDLKFFVVSVIIQKESGGNLAEILENIGRLIRERFALQGRIQTLAGEAKLSAYILIALPFFVALFLFFFNREYIMLLTTDPLGKRMVSLAIFLLIVGIYIMKKMIQIKV
jgi:tight adherence protein B